MFAYNSWANNLFLDCLSDNTVANAKVYLLMSHLLAAEEIWLCRLKSKMPSQQKLWQEMDLPNLKEKAKESYLAWDLWLQGYHSEDFSTEISYYNSKGQAFTTSVADILAHVINHGTYHRAQIATLLRLESVDPPSSDYIVYVRQM